MTTTELARDILLALIAKSGVREYYEPAAREAMTVAALEMAANLTGEGFEFMPTKVLIQAQDGTPKQIVFADHAGDFSPTAANDLRISTDGSNELDVQLAIASVANAAYRQSAKFDFGENRAEKYAIKGAIELAATPTAGQTLPLYMGWSDSGTAGTGNPANLTGSDAAYTGYSSNAAASVLQLDLIGVLVCTAQATGTVQVMEGGEFVTRARYGILVVGNSTGAAIHSDDVECNIVFNPIVPEIQNA